jgi:hypothetical protein
MTRLSHSVDRRAVDRFIINFLEERMRQSFGLAPLLPAVDITVGAFFCTTAAFRRLREGKHLASQLQRSYARPSEIKTPTVGLMGFGALGQLIATHLHSRLPLLVCDAIAPQITAALRSNVRVGDVVTVARCDVVILAVPVSELVSAIRSLRPHLRPGTIVLDDASVKIEPAKVMDCRQSSRPANDESSASGPFRRAANGRPRARQRLVGSLTPRSWHCSCLVASAFRGIADHCTRNHWDGAGRATDVRISANLTSPSRGAGQWACGARAQGPAMSPCT